MTGEVWDFFRNARLVRVAMEYSTLFPDYLRTIKQQNNAGISFEGLNRYVMFLGIGRSGTTLAGSLLDAHPNIVVANEQNVLKYLSPFPFSRERIFQLLLRNSAKQAGRGRPGGGGYSYAVPGQHQGRAAKIEVIGDKSRSAQSVEWLTARPGTLDRLSKTVQLPITVLHVIRNPFDTIARRSLRRGVPVKKMAREYFVLTGQMAVLLRRLDANPGLGVAPVELHLEDLINRPAQVMAGLCSSLGVRPSPSYLDACASIVYKKPGRARDLVSWSPELVRNIEHEIEAVPWLRRYSFEGE